MRHLEQLGILEIAEALGTTERGVNSPAPRPDAHA